MQDERLNVAVTGASGLVGSALGRHLEALGHRLRPMVRRGARSNAEIEWAPTEGRLDPEALRGVDALVNLAGENLAAGRWSERRKGRIRDSRILGTRLVAETLAAMERPPGVLISASAIGYYGNRGDEELDERSPAGSGFLARLCVDWEAETLPAERRGIRVVRLRIGVVLSPEGGALAKMLPVFKLGLGGRLGTGRQYMSWIGRSDLVRIITFALTAPDLAGPVNAVAPSPVRNAEFTRALGRVLRRPTFFAVPAPLIRLGLGEMGRETLLAGAKILPRSLERAGFRHDFPDLDGALRFETARSDG